MEGQTKPENDNDNKCTRFILSEKSMKHQLRLRWEDNEKVKDLKYQFHGDVTKERRAESIEESLRDQLLSMRADVDNYRQHLPLYTEWFTADVTDGFSGILYIFGYEDQEVSREAA